MAILVEIMYAAVGEEWHGPDCGSADGARGEERWRTADAAVAATEQRCPRASRLLTALRVIAHQPVQSAALRLSATCIPMFCSQAGFHPHFILRLARFLGRYFATLIT